MKKYLIYRQNGVVIMVSDEKIEVAGHLTQKSFTVDEEKEKQNWNKKIKDGKLVYEKPAYLENAEKKTLMEEKKEALNNATTINEIKQIQKYIIDLIN